MLSVTRWLRLARSMAWERSRFGLRLTLVSPMSFTNARSPVHVDLWR
jgi:hypothetical protein